MIVAPSVSVTVATTVWGELGVTVAVVDPLTFSTMLAGGQVEKKPDCVAVEELETFAVMSVLPGRFAVAIPFSSMETMPELSGVKLTWPTEQVMLFAGVTTPLS